MQCCAVFGVVDVLAREHSIDSCPHAGLLGEFVKQRERVFIEALTAEVEEQVSRFEPKAIGPIWIRVEQRADAGPVEFVSFFRQRGPGWSQRTVGFTGHSYSVTW